MAVCTMLIVMAAACSNSEDDDIIWDIANFKIDIQVCNSQGQNVTGQVESMAPKAIWKGKTYELNANRKQVNVAARTRALMAVFEGLFTDNGHLYFGELSGSTTYTNEQLVIEWQDGTKNTIVFNHELVWKDNEPIFNQSFKLDGKTVSKIIIIKE